MNGMRFQPMHVLIVLLNNKDYCKGKAFNIYTFVTLNVGDSEACLQNTKEQISDNIYWNIPDM